MLRNIPYVSDGESKADDEFLYELVENYEGRVHGELGGYMNDVILVDLIQSMMRFQKQQQQQSITTRQSPTTSSVLAANNPNQGVNSDMFVFEKIAECFPDKGNAYEIKESIEYSLKVNFNRIII